MTTVKIHSTHPASQGLFVIIDKADFDADKHELFDDGTDQGVVAGERAPTLAELHAAHARMQERERELDAERERLDEQARANEAEAQRLAADKAAAEKLARDNAAAAATADAAGKVTKPAKPAEDKK